MKKLIAVWIAVALSAGACAWQAEYTHVLTDFERACVALGEEMCIDLDAPTVVIGRVPLILEAYGLYIKGEPYVYVLPQSEMDTMSAKHRVKRWPSVGEVTFHETIHYILDYQYESTNRCDSEGIARDLTADEYGFVEDGRWRARYDCGPPQA